MVNQHIYDMNKWVVTDHSYETCKVLFGHGLDINQPVEYYGDILQCAVEDDNLDWVTFCLENDADPTSIEAYNEHHILAIAATYASIEICKLLIVWGAKIRCSSALTIASSSGKADLVTLLLKNAADANEMGVASIDENPEDLEGTALHLIEKGRKDILQILLDHGADVNQKDRRGKTVMLRMYENGDEVLWPILMKNGGAWR